MKYSVVIVTYNRLELLKECVDCILKQDRSFDEIIIVDNGSIDGTKEYLSEFSGKNKFTVLRYEVNGGGAFGFHEGIKEVKNHTVDWVLLIDDDAMLDISFLKSLDDFILNDKKPVLAYSSSVFLNEKICFRHRTRKIINSFYLMKSVSKKEYEKKYFDCDAATFCGLMINRSIIEEIGYPKSEYFIWNDDMEYCERINNITPIRNVNKARLNHKTNATFNDLNWKMYYGARNEIDMVKLHYGFINLFLCLLRIAARTGKYLLLAKKYNYTYIEIFYLYSQAVYDGLHGILGVNKRYYPQSK